MRGGLILNRQFRPWSFGEGSGSEVSFSEALVHLIALSLLDHRELQHNDLHLRFERYSLPCIYAETRKAYDGHDPTI